MIGGRGKFGIGVSVIALTLASGANAQDGLPVNIGEEDNNSSRGMAKALEFTVPLQSSDRVFGDVLINVAAGGTIEIDASDLRNELAQILNGEGVDALDVAIAERSFVSPESLRIAGFDLQFDESSLSLAIVSIRPQYRRVRPLGRVRAPSNSVEFDTIRPAGFSSYLNLTGNYDYDTRAGSRNPDLFLDGATRIGGVVLEYDGAFTDQFSESYRFFRRSTRAVYDDPDSYRRYSAGDVRINSLSVLRAPQIGGVAVEKSRRIFDPSFSVSRLPGGQIFLDNRSTVDVLINGDQFDSFQLEAGAYDLASLPIQQGANDIQLKVRDSFGKEQIIDYDFFFEPLTLEAGEEEYSFGLGVLSEALSFEPSYSDTVAASGYYRKALSQDLILGGAFQATKDTQLLGATVSVVPQVVPGVFDLEAAGSTSGGETGVTIRAGYRFQSGNGLDGSQQFSINVDYESAGFTTIDNILPVNFDLLSASVSYSRSFSETTFATVGANYLKVGTRPKDEYNVFVDVNHRLSPRLRLSLGAEYGMSAVFDRTFGVRAGLTLALGRRTRANVDYRSRSDSLRGYVARGADNTVGSFGYDVGFAKFGDDTQANAQLEYVANRFEVRGDLSSGGQSFGSVFDRQKARVQIGTSLAIADGTFGIGRPINDAFLVAEANAALGNKAVVTGRNLSGSDYYARSGPLGGAILGNLSSYSDQSVQFDAADPDEPFDVGDGIVRIDPPYKSGYSLNVGDEHFVSVIGILRDADGPVSLSTGRIYALDEDEKFESLPFFTNTNGRFGLFGLAPGRRYEVRLTEGDRRFTIEIAAETPPVIRMDDIIIASEE